jgi:mono/diheme cytochrome c family protein
MRLRKAVSVIAVLLAITIVSACSQSAAPEPTTQPPAAPSNGETLLNARCTGCHGVDLVTSATKSAEEWTSTIERMIDKGATLSTEEAKALAEYLAQTFQ